MCGIAGIFSPKPITPGNIQTVERINDIQKHRGPDDEGIYHDGTCVLGHRRLAIIDLSRDGRQPFHSDDNRYHMVFNGEIYNYLELKEELASKGWNFWSKTDVEVLLKMLIEYGIACLERLNGMFAFAFYDSKLREMYLARDRVGIKPLYYAFLHDDFYFASELKALRSIEGLDLSLDNQALFEFLCFNRTDVHDETFHNEIKRLPKGHYAMVGKERFEIRKWWNPLDYIEVENDEDETQIAKKIEEILISSVKYRLQSDVPVGSCLSGGLDSTIITGILFDELNIGDQYKTFTASFPGHAVDETRFIDLLKGKFRFQNFRTYPTGDDALENLQDFVYANDEPTTNPSFYSQYEVMRLARSNGITVLLDGQGGDENFAGYQYFHGFNFTELFKKKRFLRLIAELIKSFVRKQDVSAYQTFLFQIFPDRIKKKLLLRTLPHIQPDFFHHHIEKSPIYNEFFTADTLNLSLVRHFQYKLEHLLRMEDRNSMAFSIEARVPYLDHRMIEYVLSIPAKHKVQKGENKLLQKKSVGHFTIPEILHRKDKIAFGTPGSDWMKQKNWQEMTENNYSRLQSEFPGVFVRNADLKYGDFERWKINQLAVWNDLNWKKSW